MGRPNNSSVQTGTKFAIMFARLRLYPLLISSFTNRFRFKSIFHLLSHVLADVMPRKARADRASQTAVIPAHQPTNQTLNHRRIPPKSFPMPPPQPDDLPAAAALPSVWPAPGGAKPRPRSVFSFCRLWVRHLLKRSSAACQPTRQAASLPCLPCGTGCHKRRRRGDPVPPPSAGSRRQRQTSASTFRLPCSCSP